MIVLQVDQKRLSADDARRKLADVVDAYPNCTIDAEMASHVDFCGIAVNEMREAAKSALDAIAISP